MMAEWQVGGPRRVFISYANQDRDVARAVAERLEQDGMRVWSNDRITPGERWGAAVQESLANADDIVILVSEAALSSANVSMEIAAAVAVSEAAVGKRILPVVLDDRHPHGLLASYQWLVAERKHPAEVADQVARALSTPVPESDKSAARADELRGLRTVEERLARLRDTEARIATRRSHLIGWSFIIILLLASVATAVVAVISGGQPIVATLTTVVGASVGLLGVVTGYYFGRNTRGDRHE